MGNKFCLLISLIIISEFITGGNSFLFGSIVDYVFGSSPNFNLTRTCFKVTKNLHLTVLSNDCESVINDSKQPINKLTKADRIDSLRKPFSGNINLNWLIGEPYTSPYNKKRTNIRVGFIFFQYCFKFNINLYLNLKKEFFF